MQYLAKLDGVRLIWLPALIVDLGSGAPRDLTGREDLAIYPILPLREVPDWSSFVQILVGRQRENGKYLWWTSPLVAVVQSPP